jgi:hypothetical protein
MIPKLVFLLPHPGGFEAAPNLVVEPPPVSKMILSVRQSRNVQMESYNE